MEEKVRIVFPAVEAYHDAFWHCRIVAWISYDYGRTFIRTIITAYDAGAHHSRIYTPIAANSPYGTIIIGDFRDEGKLKSFYLDNAGAFSISPTISLLNYSIAEVQFFKGSIWVARVPADFIADAKMMVSFDNMTTWSAMALPPAAFPDQQSVLESNGLYLLVLTQNAYMSTDALSFSEIILPMSMLYPADGSLYKDKCFIVYWHSMPPPFDVFTTSSVAEISPTQLNILSVTNSIVNRIRLTEKNCLLVKDGFFQRATVDAFDTIPSGVNVFDPSVYSAGKIMSIDDQISCFALRDAWFDVQSMVIMKDESIFNTATVAAATPGATFTGYPLVITPALREIKL